MHNNDILFETLTGPHGNIGLITLNRPDYLNALNQGMCIAMDAQLAAWENTDAIKAVVIRGAGERAFCAGGDIRALYQSRDGNHAPAQEFFRCEYRVNRRIYHFSKPYIALLDGLTMGGGMGLSINGKYRVGTEKLKLAMPETGIGFFPDVGGSHFLPRCRGKMGWYLGLTGVTIQVADAHYAGLVTSTASSADMPVLMDALLQAVWGDDLHTTATQVLQSFAITTLAAPLAEHQATIDQCFSQPTVESILAQLAQQADVWSQDTLKLLNTRSPTSLKVVLEELNRGASLSFDDNMRMEFRVANQFLLTPDFYEGVRAAIIDKDRSPRWQPASLVEIKEGDVARYFAPLAEELVFAEVGMGA